MIRLIIDTAASFRRRRRDIFAWVMAVFTLLAMPATAFAQSCPAGAHEVGRSVVDTPDGKTIRLKCACDSGLVLKAGRCVRDEHAPEMARIGDVKGDVYVKNSSGITRIGAGYELREGDVITTATNGSVDIAYVRSGYRVRLHENSEFRVTRRTADEELYDLGKGLVRLWVSALEGKRSFGVRTPTSALAVRGTEFDVSFVEGLTRVRVYAGEVAVTPVHRTDAIVVTAGNQVTVDSSGAAIGPGPIGN